MCGTSPEELEVELRETGFCVLESVIPPARCREIRDSLTQTVRREHVHYETGRRAAQQGVGFTPSVINHDQTFAEHLADERVLELVGRLLGPHPRISFTSATINRPGNQRGGWHADWPFNQNNAGHVSAPYPDVVMHLTTLWMLSAFGADNGGTLVVPASHRDSTNPTADDGPDPQAVHPAETHVCGAEGSVLVFDSRLWHATAPNTTTDPRVALVVRYAPWWLNLEVLRPESAERRHLCAESGATENYVPSIRREIFEQLPQQVKPLYRHWIAD